MARDGKTYKVRAHRRRKPTRKPREVIQQPTEPIQPQVQQYEPSEPKSDVLGGLKRFWDKAAAIEADTNSRYNEQLGNLAAYLKEKKAKKEQQRLEKAQKEAEEANKKAEAAETKVEKVAEQAIETA